MEQTLAVTEPKQDQARMIETVLLQGDLSKLSPAQRVNYYQEVCKSIGVNPLTRPFDYITLNGKLTLYPKKDAADQLRKIHAVSIDDVDIKEEGTQFIVKVKGHDGTGRADVELGVVDKQDMRGNVANAMMKAVTKAKRRFTLSICGLGFLDETEVQTIPDARPVIVDETGEIKPTMTYDQALNVLVKHKGKDERIGDIANSPALQYIAVNEGGKFSPEQVEAALTVLEHDFSMPRPGAGQ